MSGQNSLETIARTFGADRVEQPARREMVRGLFDRIAPRYDLMNDLMSFGMHRLWKRVAAREAVSAAQGNSGPLIDLAGGTGDLARRCKAGLPGREVINIDASPGMIAVAARQSGGIGLVVAEGENLPVADDTVAAVILAFGLRNMTDPRRALREIVRTLKPGGTLTLLEFSTPYAWLAPFYRLYSTLVIPALGTLVAGDRRAYRYLIESIRQFPGVDTMTAELRSAGFSTVTVKRLSFGIAALHIARKS